MAKHCNRIGGNQRNNLTMSDKPNYYISNKDLLPEVKKFKRSGEMSEELGEMIMKIAKRYIGKGNFSGYSTDWKEDMVQDAALTCVKGLHNFDPEKSNNPFAYITTICSNAFKHYLKTQKKHRQIKDTCYKNSDVFDSDYTHRGVDYTIISPKKKK